MAEEIVGGVAAERSLETQVVAVLRVDGEPESGTREGVVLGVAEQTVGDVAVNLPHLEKPDGGAGEQG